MALDSIRVHSFRSFKLRWYPISTFWWWLEMHKKITKGFVLAFTCGIFWAIWYISSPYSRFLVWKTQVTFIGKPIHHLFVSPASGEGTAFFLQYRFHRSVSCTHVTQPLRKFPHKKKLDLSHSCPTQSQYRLLINNKTRLEGPKENTRGAAKTVVDSSAFWVYHWTCFLWQILRDLRSPSSFFRQRKSGFENGPSSERKKIEVCHFAHFYFNFSTVGNWHALVWLLVFTSTACFHG